MSIFNRLNPLTGLCRKHITYVFPKIRSNSTVLRKYTRCQNLCHSAVFVSAHHRHIVFPFRGFSDTDSDFNNLSKDDPSGDNHTAHGSPEGFTLDVLVALLRQENALDICVVKVPEQIKYAEYFIVVSGLSTRHLKAMALYAIKVYKYLKKSHVSDVKIEGRNADDWMCIDFGNMVVHFMLPESREVYELEKLWTLRSFDEQLKNMPEETLPEDFIYDLEVSK